MNPDFDPLCVPCIVCGAAKGYPCRTFLSDIVHGFRLDAAKKEHGKPK